MSGCRPLLTAFALLLSAAASAAAPIDPLGTPAQIQRQLEALNARPLPDGRPLALAVIAAVQADAVRRDLCRPTSITLGPLRPVTLDSMVSDMILKGQIDNGWLVSAKLANCPPAEPIQVLLLRGPDGVSLKGFFAGQGESLAWPSLAAQAIRGLSAQVGITLRAKDPACTPADVTATGVTIAERSPDLAPDRLGIRLKGSWREVWTFAPCRHRIAIPIAFTADGKGGATWRIAADQVVFVP